MLGHFSKRVKNDVLTKFTEGVIMADYTMSAGEDVGMRHIIGAFNDGKIPAGLSASNVRREVDRLFVDNMKELREELMKHTQLTRSISVQHDGWTSKQQEGLLGITISYVDTMVKPWKIKFQRLGMVPSHADHTAAHTRSLITEQMKIVGLTWKDIISGTSDTTGAYCVVELLAGFLLGFLIRRLFGRKFPHLHPPLPQHHQ